MEYRHNAGSSRSKDWKLIGDPFLNPQRYPQKVYRNEDTHSKKSPERPRDPRDARTNSWTSRREPADLPIPNFKYDEYYVGDPIEKEITFDNLNDNITSKNLSDMCKVFGVSEDAKVYFHPKTKKHLGIGKVVFRSSRAASECAQKLNNTSKMGNIMSVFVDTMGRERHALLQQRISGVKRPPDVPGGIGNHVGGLPHGADPHANFPNHLQHPHRGTNHQLHPSTPASHPPTVPPPHHHQHDLIQRHPMHPGVPPGHRLPPPHGEYHHPSHPPPPQHHHQLAHPPPPFEETHSTSKREDPRLRHSHHHQQPPLPPHRSNVHQPPPPPAATQPGLGHHWSSQTPPIGSDIPPTESSQLGGHSRHRHHPRGRHSPREQITPDPVQIIGSSPAVLPPSAALGASDTSAIVASAVAATISGPNGRPADGRTELIPVTDRRDSSISNESGATANSASILQDSLGALISGTAQGPSDEESLESRIQKLLKGTSLSSGALAGGITPSPCGANVPNNMFSALVAPDQGQAPIASTPLSDDGMCTDEDVSAASATPMHPNTPPSPSTPGHVAPLPPPTVPLSSTPVIGRTLLPPPAGPLMANQLANRRTLLPTPPIAGGVALLPTPASAQMLIFYLCGP